MLCNIEDVENFCMRKKLLVKVKYQGNFRLQANLSSQQYFDRLVLVGQREEYSRLEIRNDKDSCWEPCSLCGLKSNDQLIQ